MLSENWQRWHSGLKKILATFHLSHGEKKRHLLDEGRVIVARYLTSWSWKGKVVINAIGNALLQVRPHSTTQALSVATAGFPKATEKTRRIEGRETLKQKN